MSSDESFFREVDEDYRRHQTAEFFKKYGMYIGAAAFIIVAVVAGYSIERFYSAKNAESGGDRFVSALTLAEDGKQAEAQKALAALAENGPGSYKVLARLNLASEAVASQQKDTAMTQYRAVADDASAPETLRDFARIQMAVLSVDTEPFDVISRQLDGYRSGTNPWRFLAKEALALSALKAGKRPDAEKLFQEIYSDGAASQGTRQRAEVMLALTLEKPKAPANEVTNAKTQ